MTNYIETLQSQGTCNEEYDKLKAICKIDADCQSLAGFMNTWNGIPTGKCITSSNQNTKTCEVNRVVNNLFKLLIKFD